MIASLATTSLTSALELKYSPLTEPDMFNMTMFGAASDENFFDITT